MEVEMKKTPMTTWQKWLLGAGVALMVSFVAAVAFLMYAMSRISF